MLVHDNELHDLRTAHVVDQCQEALLRGISWDAHTSRQALPKVILVVQIRAHPGQVHAHYRGHQRGGPDIAAGPSEG